MNRKPAAHISDSAPASDTPCNVRSNYISYQHRSVGGPTRRCGVCTLHELDLPNGIVGTVEGLDAAVLVGPQRLKDVAKKPSRRPPAIYLVSPESEEMTCRTAREHTHPWWSSVTRSVRRSMPSSWPPHECAETMSRYHGPMKGLGSVNHANSAAIEAAGVARRDIYLS
ncbi:hypothetical protein CONLIGDRAFT_642587 [Coniochaeta ligniaria NRRL 30616]|uniref:Uncharacterized protein n=1 Tax=Coniochaeta ligniaria NRRL 30616 TaxID=1408157 RepID=A0A1J7ISM9_9PEZI|nr:hypothetical protein CONLIGDRAFT_642587 [Coniochaeta ligniaria NRRL 30616]